MFHGRSGAISQGLRPSHGREIVLGVCLQGRVELAACKAVVLFLASAGLVVPLFRRWKLSSISGWGAPMWRLRPVEARLHLSQAQRVEIGAPRDLVVASIHQRREEFRIALNRPVAQYGRPRSRWANRSPSPGPRPRPQNRRWLSIHPAAGTDRPCLRSSITALGRRWIAGQLAVDARTLTAGCRNSNAKTSTSDAIMTQRAGVAPAICLTKLAGQTQLRVAMNSYQA